jgi:hypothetical protein
MEGRSRGAGFLIIDGYNLLHATGIFGRGRGPASLERSRRALLGFLAASLAAEQRVRTTVVFDAGPRAAGLPDSTVHRGITVRYASRHEDADDLIEKLIQLCSAPRLLTVVSSDHRLQRAARRRRARAVDSSAWYLDIMRQRRDSPAQGARPFPPETSGSLSEEEVEYWLAQFGLQHEGGADESGGGPKSVP